MKKMSRTKRLTAAGALILAGAGVGAAVATTGAATAASSDSGSSASSTAPGGSTAIDPSQPQRSDEKLLTGTTKTKVIAVALAKYPGATIERAETDSDGVYEAHIVTKAGAHVIVQVGKDFTVTGTQTGPGSGSGAPSGAPANGSTPTGAPSGAAGAAPAV